MDQDWRGLLYYQGGGGKAQRDRRYSLPLASLTTPEPISARLARVSEQRSPGSLFYRLGALGK